MIYKNNKNSTTINIKKLRSKNKNFFFFKRLMDITGAGIGLLFLFPLFVVIGILIKMENPKGSIFFKQIRVGKNEKNFEMYKFRSMCTDAEEKLKDIIKMNEKDGAMFKMRNDPRVTKIGSFIRKTSIDELPQLLNVLKGEMSLVGPRPPLVREFESYTDYDKQRLKITPGLTGLWQVSGKNNIGFHEMVDLDIQYISNLSFRKDIMIILKTFSVIFNEDGNY